MGGQIAIDAAKSRERLARSISRLVQTPKFGIFWDYCNDDEHNQALQLILNSNLDGLISFIREKRRKDLSSWNVIDLRRFARKFGISDAHILPKYMLVFLIEQGISEDERFGNDRQNQADASADEGNLLSSGNRKGSIQETSWEVEESSSSGLGETIQFLGSDEQALSRIQTDLGSAHEGRMGTVADTGWNIFKGAESSEGGEGRTS